MCDIVNQDLLRVTGENNKPEECKDFRALKGVLQLDLMTTLNIERFMNQDPKSGKNKKEEDMMTIGF